MAAQHFTFHFQKQQAVIINETGYQSRCGKFRCSYRVGREVLPARRSEQRSSSCCLALLNAWMKAYKPHRQRGRTQVRPFFTPGPSAEALRTFIPVNPTKSDVEIKKNPTRIRNYLLKSSRDDKNQACTFLGLRPRTCEFGWYNSPGQQIKLLLLQHNYCDI